MGIALGGGFELRQRQHILEFRAGTLNLGQGSDGGTFFVIHTAGGFSATGIAFLPRQTTRRGQSGEEDRAKTGFQHAQKLSGV